MRGVILAAVAACGAAILAVAQPAGEKPMDERAKAEAEAMAAMNALGPEHRRLAEMCGTFDVTMRMFHTPESPPLELKATATRTMILGGKFLRETVECAGPIAFTSESIAGYNPDAPPAGERTSAGCYEVVRMSSMVLCQMPETGTFDEPTRTFHFSGKHAINGMHGTIRVRHTLESRDREVAVVHLSFEGYSDQFKGVVIPEYKAMEMVYTRRK